MTNSIDEVSDNTLTTAWIWSTTVDDVRYADRSSIRADVASFYAMERAPFPVTRRIGKNLREIGMDEHLSLTSGEILLELATTSLT